MRDGRAVSLSHQRVEQKPKGQNLGSEVPTSAAVPTGAVHNAMVFRLVRSRVLVTCYTGMPCELGNKKLEVPINVPVNGWWQEDACEFNRSSYSCVPTIKYNCAYPFV
jgi:hypothetical protein